MPYNTYYAFSTLLPSPRYCVCAMLCNSAISPTLRPLSMHSTNGLGKLRSCHRPLYNTSPLSVHSSVMKTRSGRAFKFVTRRWIIKSGFVSHTLRHIFLTHTPHTPAVLLLSPTEVHSPAQHLSWKLKVHYSVENSAPFIRIVGQMNPVHTLPPQCYDPLTSYLLLGLPSFCSAQIFHVKFRMHVPFLPCVLHSQFIASIFIWFPFY